MEKAAWKIEMLGGLQACSEGREPVRLSRQQTGTLFAYLALNLNQAHSREHLAALIWPDDGPEEASHKLRQSLYALRRQLGPHPAAQGDLFLATRTSVQLDPTVFETDVMLFERKVAAAAKCTSNSERIRLLLEAIGHYRGELLPGFHLEEFETQRHRLAHQHRIALQMLMHSYEQAGDLKRAIEAGKNALDLDPLVEETYCDLMRLYAACGQPSAVIQQYQALASVLKKELRATPTEAAAQLKESLLQEARLNPAASSAAALPLDAIDASSKIDAGPALQHVAPGSVQQVRRQRNRPMYAVGMLIPVACVFLALQAFSVYTGHVSRYGASRAGSHTALVVSESPYMRISSAPSTPTPSASPSVRAVQPSASPGNRHSNAGPSQDGAGHDPVSAVPTVAGSSNNTDLRPPAAIAPPSGTMLWNMRYKLHLGDKTSEAKAVVADGKGNMYVTGIVDTVDHDVDFLTTKLDDHGRIVWEMRYNGPGNDLDRAVDIALDGKGGVYVTGESDNGKGNGATRLAGLDFVTIKYDCETAKKVWVRRYNGDDDGEDRPVRLKVNDTGVYVLGKSWRGGKSANAGFDYALVKYGFDGKQQWAYRTDTGIGGDEPVDMALSRDGSIYVTGQSLHKPAGYPAELDILTMKISSTGAKMWEDRYGFENHMDDWACNIGLDRDENVYVVGTGRSPQFTPDRVPGGCITIKYHSSGGEPVWVHGTSQQSDRIERAESAVVTESGDVAVIGTTHDQNGAQVARAVYREANGLVRWNHDLCTLAGSDGPSAIAATSNGVYLSGGLRESSQDVQFFSARYGAYGGQVWSKFFDTPPCSGHANSMIADRDRMIVVGQYADERGHDFTVVCYQQ